MKEKILTWISNSNPSFYEHEERNNSKLCQYCELNEDGENIYVCSEKAKSYKIKYRNLKRTIWIHNSMLCRRHLEQLSNKYKINFIDEIPRLYLEKDWVFEIKDKFTIRNRDFITHFKELESTKLYKSLNTIFFNGNERSLNSLLDHELVWFSNPLFAIGLPRSFWETLSLYKYVNRSSNSQGIMNGPDFILLNQNNEFIGLKIVSFQWNLVNIKEQESIINYANKKVYNFSSIDKKIFGIEMILKEKIAKSKKYFQCKELYLGIIVNDTFLEYEYFILELIINNINKELDSKFKKIYIL